jgi:hypothetical protein
MAFCNPHIDDPIGKLLLENLSDFTGRKIGVTRNNLFIASGKFNECAVVRTIHILGDIPYGPQISTFHNGILLIFILRVNLIG